MKKIIENLVVVILFMCIIHFTGKVIKNLCLAALVGGALIAIVIYIRNLIRMKVRK